MTAGSAQTNDDRRLDRALQLELQERGETLVLKVSGMAAVGVVGQLNRALQEAVARRPRLLAVDISALSFISSPGLGRLVDAHVACKEHGIQMCLVHPQPFIKQVLKVTHLSELLRIRDTLEEAEQQLIPG